MDKLEEELEKDIGCRFSDRFIPYFQLHEFEGLLFNDFKVFEDSFMDHELLNKDELKAIIDTYSNPELINGNIETAPSRRLEKLIKGYNKVVYGSIIAESIGFDRIRDKSVRFSQWIEKMESI